MSVDFGDNIAIMRISFCLEFNSESIGIVFVSADNPISSGYVRDYMRYCRATIND